MEEKERKAKSEKLFDKGMECYNNQQYKEALKYFEASIKFYKNDRAELFIGVCKNNIPENDNNNNFRKSYSDSKPSSSNYSNQKPSSSSSSSNSRNNNSSNNYQNKSYSSDNIGENPKDKICKELLKKKIIMIY